MGEIPNFFAIQKIKLSVREKRKMKRFHLAQIMNCLLGGLVLNTLNAEERHLVDVLQVCSSSCSVRKVFVDAFH